MSARTSYYIYILSSTNYHSHHNISTYLLTSNYHILTYSSLSTYHSSLSIYSHILNYIHNCSSTLPEKKGKGKGKTKKRRKAISILENALISDFNFSGCQSGQCALVSSLLVLSACLSSLLL